MSISFDKRTGRYRGSDGRFIKQEKVFELLERYRIQKQNLILDELETLNNDEDYDKFLINTAEATAIRTKTKRTPRKDKIDMSQLW